VRRKWLIVSYVKVRSLRTCALSALTPPRTLNIVKAGLAVPAGPRSPALGLSSVAQWATLHVSNEAQALIEANGLDADPSLSCDLSDSHGTPPYQARFEYTPSTMVESQVASCTNLAVLPSRRLVIVLGMHRY
jgi:hypothetical protein